MKKEYIKPKMDVIKIGKTRLFCTSTTIPTMTTPLPEEDVSNIILG